MSVRILVVDAMFTNRVVLKAKLAAACHGIEQAADGATALAMARAAPPDLILSALHLPDGSATDLCRRLRADPATRHVPVLAIDRPVPGPERIAALAAGIADVLVRPVDETMLMARIRSLLRLAQSEAELRDRAEACRDFGLAEAPEGFDRPGRAGLVGTDASLLTRWRSMLAPLLPMRYLPMTPAQALAGAATAGAPDVYLIAAPPGQVEPGLRLTADLRARIGEGRAALCLALPDPATAAAAMALDLGATEVMALPIEPVEAALRLRAQLRRVRRVEALSGAVGRVLQLAATDPLTGLCNRRHGLARLDRMAAEAAIGATPLAVIVLDIDRFKAVNDRYGHAAGDAVLAAVAERLAQALRPGDLLARIGGEEFLVALHGVGPAEARRVAERLCAAVAARPVGLPGGRGSVTVTLSAGLALSGADQPGPAGPAAMVADRHAAGAGPRARATLDRADSALLAAKGSGRNNVAMAPAC